jgi:hypothetical protein
MSTFSDYFQDCLAGNQSACRKLWAAIEFDRFFRNFKLPVIALPIPVPNPKISLNMDRLQAQFEMHRKFLGDPNPQPNFPLPDLLKIKLDLREKFLAQVSLFDKEIADLEATIKDTKKTS